MYEGLALSFCLFFTLAISPSLSPSSTLSDLLAVLPYRIVTLTISSYRRYEKGVLDSKGAAIEREGKYSILEGQRVDKRRCKARFFLREEKQGLIPCNTDPPSFLPSLTHTHGKKLSPLQKGGKQQSKASTEGDG